jgi:hypothetical protein
LFNNIRPVYMLIAGALISAAISLVVQNSAVVGLYTALFIIAAILIIFGSGYNVRWRYSYNLHSRKRHLRIGILNDIDWPPDKRITTWTNVSPSDWQDALIKESEKKGLKTRVKLIRISDNFDGYTAILNPYGGAYPEKDLLNRPTLEKIFKYVQRQGLFVNVSDIPGYWVYSALVNKLTETTEPIWRPAVFTLPTGEKVEKLYPFRPFYEIPWMRRLGLNITDANRKYEKGVDLNFINEHISSELRDVKGVKTLRLVSSTEPNVRSVMKPIADDQFGNLTAMFYASYDEGEFLISLPHLSSWQGTSVTNSLKETIVNIVLARLSSNLSSTTIKSGK